jgi:sugar-phosphatase
VVVITDRAAVLLSGPGAGLLLDLDGTLVHSESVHRAAYREYFAGRGWDVEEHVLGEFTGRRAPDVFATLDGPWKGEDPVALTEGVLDALRDSSMRPLPVPGAASLIRVCARAGLPVAVVTSARRFWVRSVLGLLGVGGVPMPMVTAEDCSPGKPDPEPFRLGAQLLRAGAAIAGGLRRG